MSPLPPVLTGGEDPDDTPVQTRTGVRLGIDVGEVRVGVSASDPSGLLAVPVETVPRDRASRSDLERIAVIASQRSVIEVVVGLPLALGGTEGVAARRARGYAAELSRRLPVPVNLWDERLSTVDAHRALRDSGVTGRRQREHVDQVAAVLILQSALDAERAAGRPSRSAGRVRKPRTPRSGRSNEGS